MWSARERFASVIPSSSKSQFPENKQRLVRRYGDSMNLRVEKAIRRSGGAKEFFLAILIHPLGLNLILMFLVLLVTESCYRNYYHQAKNVIYIGGVGSVIGTILLLQAMLKIRKMFSKYSLDCSTESAQGGKFYLHVTDDFIEKGVEHLWSQRFYWKLLQGYRENRVGFVIKMGPNDVAIPFYDLDGEKNIGAFREWLKRQDERSTPHN